MAKEKARAPKKPDLFEQLNALKAPLEDATGAGVHPDVVRLALNNVLGAIDHVRSAREQADPLWRRK